MNEYRHPIGTPRESTCSGWTAKTQSFLERQPGMPEQIINTVAVITPTGRIFYDEVTVTKEEIDLGPEYLAAKMNQQFNMFFEKIINAHGGQENLRFT